MRGCFNTAVKLSLYLVVVALILFVCLEIAARRHQPEYIDDEFYFDQVAFPKLVNSAAALDTTHDAYNKKFGYVLSPNASRTFRTDDYTFTAETNSRGFRTREQEPKRAGEYRILMIGDSMIFGMGVPAEETISARLEQFSPALKIYDYSVTGYNTVQESIVAATYVSDLRPDHVILGLFVANDIIPNFFSSVDTEGNYTIQHQAVEDLRSRLRNAHSLFYHSVLFRVIAADLLIPRWRYLISREEEIIEGTFRALSQIDSVARQFGITFSVVLLYPRDAVEGGLVAFWSGSRAAGNAVADYLAAQHMEYLDILDVMTGIEARRQFFFQVDGHFNADGNEVVAQAIYERLIEEKLRNRIRDHAPD